MRPEDEKKKTETSEAEADGTMEAVSGGGIPGQEEAARKLDEKLFGTRPIK
ncbi:MAG: hypothetical protein IK082_06630 [Oscillospiraceae bacterium]|nr:hypothetical protein [Oscillospiraceae bacterium]